MDPTHDPDFQPPSAHPKIQPPVSPKLIPNRKPIQPYVLSDDENDDFNAEEDDGCLIDPVSLKDGKALDDSFLSLPTTRSERSTRRKEQSLRHKIPKKATELESSSTSSASASEEVSDAENAIDPSFYRTMLCMNTERTSW